MEPNSKNSNKNATRGEDPNYFMYSELENVNNQNLIAALRDRPNLISGDYIVTEKVHGANFKFETDGETVLYGRRKGWIGDDNFLLCQNLYTSYKPKILQLFHDVKKVMPDLKILRVFGELYGGYYTRELLRPKQKQIQSEILYNPENDLYFFDIHYTKKSGLEKWMKYTTAINFFKSLGLFYAEPLFIGPFEEAIKYGNVFDTTIPGKKGLPDPRSVLAQGYLAEGVVIKPDDEKTYDGRRVIMKNRNENSYPERPPPRPLRTDADFIDKELMLIRIALEYLTDFRFKITMNKYDSREKRSNLQKAFIDDAIKDFKKDYEELYESIMTPDAKTYMGRKLGAKAESMFDEYFKRIQEEEEKMKKEEQSEEVTL
jgi:Rnl2 family RNA ligase